MIVIMIIMVMFGLLISGISGHAPSPPLQIIFFIGGIMVAFVGMLLLYGRAIKTGAIYLLQSAQPDNMIWFYIQRDGTVKITPAFRRIEGMSESKEMDSIIQDMKAYRIFDHQVRFVPEDLGHSADVKHCVYARVMKNKYGFESIKDGRRKLLFWMNEPQSEHVRGGEKWED